MSIRRLIHIGVISACALTAGVAAAQPLDNVRPGRHPNLAAAQQLSSQAYQKVVAAQRANEYDLGGHAEKARQLLEEANRELSQAAEAANRR